MKNKRICFVLRSVCIIFAHQKKEKLRKLRREIYWGMAGLTVCVLAVVRCANPTVIRQPSIAAAAVSTAEATKQAEKPLQEKVGLHTAYAMPRFKDAEGKPLKNRIYSVPGFRRTFPDLQDVQIVAARKWGVSPVADRTEAERRKDELVYVGSNPYYTMDEHMTHSIPYLVPRASDLLQKISRNFLDSLAIKGIPLHTLIVTSVLRTEHDVRRLRRFNVNASEASCHRFGTTFDISYHRYVTVQPPSGPERRAVRNDTLKWVLSEVLRDLREAEMCYVKYEVKQGCFHITVR